MYPLQKYTFSADKSILRNDNSNIYAVAGKFSIGWGKTHVAMNGISFEIYRYFYTIFSIVSVSNIDKLKALFFFLVIK